MLTSIRIRELLNTQTHDITWLFETSKVINVDLKSLETSTWYKDFWCDEWGKVVILPNKEKEDVLVWHRTDGGMSIASIEHSISIRMINFALLAELAKHLKMEGKLSYVEVGLRGSERAKILFNGIELSHVISADALIGICKIAAKDSKGKLVFNKDLGIIEERVLKGDVEILLEEQTLSFF